MNVPDLLAWSARRYAEKECIVEVDPESGSRKCLTYRQLDERVNKAANALIAAGLKKGDRVLHFMKNRTEWIESYFATIRIGGIIVPLNFRFTSADLDYVVQVVQPSVTILEAGLMGVTTDFASRQEVFGRFVFVGDRIPEGMMGYEAFIAGRSKSQPGTEICEDDDLGIYFTSGTTGLPKPIVYTHNNLYAITVSNGFTIPLPPDHNSIIYCPLYHTAAFFFWLPCLFHGGKGTILQKFSPHNLLKTIEQEAGTEVLVPMPHCVDLVTAQQTGRINVKDYDLSTWQLVNTGAQPYPPSVMKEIGALFPSVGIRYGFGISEGGGATLLTIGPEEVLKRPGSVGKPSVMVEAKIIDAAGQELPSGIAGELVIKSERTMKGYYQNPKATTETIRDGWLFTGDIAKKDEEGYFYIIDRKKDVVISGGENVYPVEVENVLMTHPQIMEVAVIGTPDDKWGELVTAVVKPKPGEQLTKEALLEWCREQFPSYKRPRRVEFGEIPKNPTNKILKHELRLIYGGKNSAF